MEVAVKAKAPWRRWLSLALGVVGVGLVIGTPVLWLYRHTFDHWAESALMAGFALILYFLYENRVGVARALGGRVARYGTNTTVMIVMFVAIVLFINLLAALNVQRLDLTANKAFTLSPQTLTVLSRIPSPLQITVFLPGLEGKGPIEDVLKEYARQSDKVNYRFIDMTQEPGLAKQYKIQSPTIVVEHEGSRKDIYTWDEQPLTSAILTVITKKPKKVYLTTGHRELDPNNTDADGGAALKQILENEAYQVETLNLAVVDKIPADASVVVLAGPKDPIPEQQMWVLESYISYGGKVLMLTDPGSQDENMKNMLSRWGLEAGKGTVVEAATPFLGDPLTPVVYQYPFSLITKDLGETVFPNSTSITVSKNLPAWLQAQPLIFTSDRSWLKTKEGAEKLSKDQLNYEEGKDVRGPLSIAAVVMGQLELGAEQKTRMVVVGNSTFATNRYLATFSGNRDFIANSVNWLAEEEELITIRANPPEDRAFILDPMENLILMGSSVIGLPLLVLLAGGAVWWVRR
ncbi:MAG: GldG family protein [Bacteroidetes bacterium]|nr:GldG family protein [Bacteroidota bacterium]MCL5027377.1 GldG family protein [Chloroflexota bacterium]